MDLDLTLPDWLASANQEFRRSHPGEPGTRQPVHTVYGGAHLFKATTCQKLGKLAERALAEYAPDAATLALATGVPEAQAETVYTRVVEKLRREPVEDYRIDFEDGYGIRPDAEEDASAESAAAEFVKGQAEGTLPPFCGIRIKPLSEESKERGMRTLGRFLSTAGALPENFLVTLPKITVIEQVRALAEALDDFPSVQIEIMVETPQALVILPKLVEAARGRCVAANFGPYDYSSSLGITSTQQDMRHPVCDFARFAMQNSLAGTGVRMSDGPTTILPVSIHRGESLDDQQKAANGEAVHRAWKAHYENIRHGLRNGFYQSLDLHPAQLPVRYAAVYSFFLEGLEAASERLRNFIAVAAKATRVGSVFDDAATGQALLNYFLRAVRCCAIPESDVLRLTGLTPAQLRSGSFLEILKTR
ncbi:MAG TPA: hypothetical protein VK687_08760 [Bryobacteraceae bacterium]|nr:hypothetical protein [Bryobacteraceae bacterium]